MKNLLFIPLLLLSLISSPSWAQDFDKGLAAYEGGDHAGALREFTPLAEQGHTDAQFHLGVMYLLGEGVLQDYIYAHMWGNIAARGGHEQGGNLRDEVAEVMTPASIAAAHALARECSQQEYKDC